MFPREHGATAMLLVPMFSAALLARTWRWTEIAALLAAFSALAVKDPLVTLARQRLVWRTPHEETRRARHWLAAWMAALAICGSVLAATWPPEATAAMGAGALGFSILAVFVNVKNRQRSVPFQIASAAALTSGCLAMSLSATGSVAPWSMRLWGLMALQSATGILVVHARLDARIALRAPASASATYRRASSVLLGAVGCAAAWAAFAGSLWIATGLALILAGYGYDLRRQRDAADLQRPLTSVGRRALAISTAFAVLVTVGLWR